MRPVVLTRLYESGKEEPVYVNPDRITHFAGDAWTNLTRIWFGADCAIRVKESPGELQAILERNRSWLRAEDRDGVGVAP